MLPLAQWPMMTTATIQMAMMKVTSVPINIIQVVAYGTVTKIKFKSYRKVRACSIILILEQCCFITFFFVIPGDVDEDIGEREIPEDSSSDVEGEWVPSSWSSLAQPSRSALKSPDKSTSVSL